MARMNLPKEGAFFLQLIILVTLAVAGGATIGFLLKGLDTQAIIDQYQFYAIYAIFGAFALIGSFTAIKAITSRNKRYGDSVLFAQQGLFPSIPVFNRFTRPQLFMLSLILFLSIGLVGQISPQQKAFFGLVGVDAPLVSQQFTPTGSVIFSTILVPLAENLFLAGILAVLISILLFYSIRFGISRGEYRLYMGFLVVIASTAFWFSWHSLVYADSDIARFSTALFGLAIAILTLMTGSFIPAWILHLVNNLYLDIGPSFSSETQAFLIMGGIISILIILYGVIYRGRYFGERGAIT